MEAAAPLVDVRSTGISEVVEQERILELPLEGRNPAALIAMVGGVVQETTEQQEHARLALYGRGRKPAVRRGVPARRRPAQQPLRQPEHAAAVSRRAAGVPRRDERALRRQRRPLGRLGQRGDEVGHECAPWNALRVPARQAIQRESGLCAHRSQRPASAWTTASSAISSAARWAVRS